MNHSGEPSSSPSSSSDLDTLGMGLVGARPPRQRPPRRARPPRQRRVVIENWTSQIFLLFLFLLSLALLLELLLLELLLCRRQAKVRGLSAGQWAMGNGHVGVAREDGEDCTTHMTVMVVPRSKLQQHHHRQPNTHASHSRLVGEG